MTLPTFSADDRVDPPLGADETTTLRAFLDYHRDTFRWKCAGLTQEQLAQALPPTDMTLGGMMKHLAVVESGRWHRCIETSPRAGTANSPVDGARTLRQLSLSPTARARRGPEQC